MKTQKLENRILFLSPSVEAGWQKQSHLTDFKLIQKIGSGSFGTVHKAIHKKTQRVFAIKQIKKSTLDSQKLLEHARTQVKIMYKLNHPYIIKLHNHFQDEISIFLVLQYAAKGQIFNLLKAQPDIRFQQREAAQFIRQITQGIKQIHSKGIMHRDLKLQNILVDEENNIKIADFGWSHFLDPEKRTTYCGTVDYLAPQMVQKGHKHDERVDIWSIGVLIYELTTGYSPFSCTLSAKDASVENVKKNIKNVMFKIPSFISKSCQQLIRGILKANPNDRLTIDQILKHIWIINNTKQKKQSKVWMQSLKSEMKQMFPDQPNTNNQGKQFSKQELYTYTRPDSIINLKPKKKKDEVIVNSPSTSSTSSPQRNQTKFQNIDFQNNQLEKTFYNKKMGDLELKIMELEIQSRKDKQQIARLREQLLKVKDFDAIKKQNQQLLDQITIQNKSLQIMGRKLNESENKLLQYEKKPQLP